MASTPTSSREARRRRIMERGSDRLNLITGRIHNLTPSSSFNESSPTAHHAYTASCPPSLSRIHSDLSNQPKSVFNEVDDTDSTPLLQKHDPNTESGQLNDCDVGSRAQPYMCLKCATRVEASDPNEIQPLRKVQKPSVSTFNTAPHFEPRIDYHKVFSPNQISSAIAATKSTRTNFSILAAILIVLSYVGFPIIGSYIISSIILFRPLYLLLLTNISIVVARLLSEEQRVTERVEQETNSDPSDGFGLDQVGKTLESGLLLQNIVSALFMDCSVYAVVVVCGITLANALWG